MSANLHKREKKGSGLFSWPASWSSCGFQAESNNAAFDPAVIAERKAALNAGSERFEFSLGLGMIHPGSPLARKRWIIGYGQPTALARRLLATHHKVPVIRHRHHRKDRQRDNLPSLIKHSHERGIVLRFLENRQPSDRSIEHMKYVPSRANSFDSCHSHSVTTRLPKTNRPDPFSLLFTG
jgi:hypothetical protein